MKNLLISLLLLIAFSSAFAIQRAGNGTGALFISNNCLRANQYAAYHTNSDDTHWYGTSKWAVLYNFASYFPSEDSLQFDIDGFKVYLPQANDDNITVKMYDDNKGRPNFQKVLHNKTYTQVHAGWFEAATDSTFHRTLIWLVVEYNTDQTHTVSTSNGDGTHSYFWNENLIVPQFQNMATSGYQSELLFSLRGSFNAATPDIALQSFDFYGEKKPGRHLQPIFTIVNNSDQVIPNCTLKIKLTAPTAQYTLADSLYISTPIQPYGFLVVDSLNSNQYSLGFNITRQPCQFSVTATLSSNSEPLDLGNNNSKTLVFNTWTARQPHRFIETFLSVRSSTLEQLLRIQDSDTNALKLYYFSNVADSLWHREDATNRANYYRIPGLPVTIFSGTTNITGFIDSLTYYNDFIVKQHLSEARPTFITGSHPDVRINNGHYTVSIALNNDNQYALNSYLANLQLITGVAQRAKIRDRGYLIYLKTIDQFSAFTLGNTPESMITRDFDFSPLNVDELTTNESPLDTLYLVYILQNKVTNEILYTGLIDLPTITSAPEPVAPASSVSVYPNPITIGESLVVRSEQSVSFNNIEIALYNIKGQRCWYKSQAVLQGKQAGITLPQNSDLSAGVYIMQISLSQNGKSVSSSTKKVVILRK